MLSSGNMNESWLYNSTYVNQLEVMNKNFSIVQIVGLMLLALLVIFIISGNVLVICAFLSVARNLRTITNYFVVSLAVSDILVGSFSVPFWMWVKIKQHEKYSVPHYIFIAFDIMCGVASIVNLTVISLERLFAVIRPASHRNLSRQTDLILGVIGSVWVYAFVNSGLYFVKGWKSYTIYIVILNFFIPALIIVGSYIAIYKVAQLHASEQRRLKQEMRLAGMIAIVIALFVACWFPFFLVNLLFDYCSLPTCESAIIKKSISFVKFLHYSNSMMNPIVYAYRNSDYRDAFKKILYSLLRYTKYKRSRSSSAMTLRSTDYDGSMTIAESCSSYGGKDRTFSLASQNRNSLI